MVSMTLVVQKQQKGINIIMEEKTAQLFHHCLRVSCENGVWQPQRFAEQTLAFYEELDEGKKLRAHSTAGITMDFVTDAEEISFSYESYGFCRPFVNFDIYENNVLMKTVKEPEYSREGRVLYRKQSKGQTRITIYLPQCVWLGVKELSLGDWKPVEEKKKRILFLGDSITQGMTVSAPSQSFPVLTAGYLQYDYINQGVGGYVFCADSLKETAAAKPDRAIVAYGTNDYSAVREGKLSLEKMRQNAAEYLETLCRILKPEKIGVISPIWRGDCDDKEGGLFLQVRDMLREESSRRGILFVDGLTLVGHQENLYVDGVHPNDWGANMYALNLLRMLTMHHF